MKTVSKLTFVLATIFIVTACTPTAKFPVSSVTPGADISATKKIDKQKNYKITLTAKNLASADRLTPPKQNYVAWIVTSDGTKNIGQIDPKNGKKTTLTTVTPYNPTEIIITAEDKGDVTYPSGMEISRATFKK